MCVFSIKWENRIEPLIWRNLCRWEQFSPLYTELTSTTSVTSHFRSAPLCTGSWWAQVAQDSCYGKCYLNKPRIRIPVAANIALLQERFPEISGAHLRNVISIIRALTGDPRGADRAGKMGNSFFYQTAAWISLKMHNGHEQRDDGDDDVDAFCTQKEYPGKMLNRTSEPGRLSAGLS